ncbi:MAG TPA: type VI secretion system baseplate subunit TssE [Myxococcota bacterium]|nr:type VI secretion system baseplate subunit TssE [Myxococcota bacterium]
MFDRLMAPESAAARAQLQEMGPRELAAAVGRDLDWLLNTKRWLPDDLEHLPEASHSILAYGLPDLSTYSWRNPGDATAIARLLEETIRRFEPRLRARSVKVTPLASNDADDFRLRFRIDATLEVEPIRMPVSFDTAVDFDASRIQVREEL